MWKRFLQWLGLENDVQVIKKESIIAFTGNAAHGDMLLGFGQHEINIQIFQKPVEVYVSIEDPVNGIGVCHGDINKIGVKILDDGFVLYADIKTNVAFIKWTCEF